MDLTGVDHEVDASEDLSPFHADVEVIDDEERRCHGPIVLPLSG
jgi:hypothetical protein